MTVFRDYDQERLDALLDVRRRVLDNAEWTTSFEQRSGRVRSSARCRLDVRYGSHARQRLDVFLPASADQMLPANVFFHGGYWRSSDKERYSFLAEGLVTSATAFVAVEYALIPEVDMDGLVRQCREAVAWMYQHANDFGIDQNRIFVSGHSAGGHIVAMLAVDGWQAALGVPADVVKGCCGVSGLYDLEPIRRSYLNATLGLDAAAAARNSPYLLTPMRSLPWISVVGDSEGDEFLRQTELIEQCWGDVADVTRIVLPDQHHYQAVAALADPAGTLGRAVLAQMASG